jgi:hypothetical protein
VGGVDGAEGAFEGCRHCWGSSGRF